MIHLEKSLSFLGIHWKCHCQADSITMISTCKTVPKGHFSRELSRFCQVLLWFSLRLWFSHGTYTLFFFFFPFLWWKKTQKIWSFWSLVRFKLSMCFFFYLVSFSLKLTVRPWNRWKMIHFLFCLRWHWGLTSGLLWSLCSCPTGLRASGIFWWTIFGKKGFIQSLKRNKPIYYKLAGGF